MHRQTERDLLNPKSYFINTIGTLKGQCQEICYLLLLILYRNFTGTVSDNLLPPFIFLFGQRIVNA